LLSDVIDQNHAVEVIQPLWVTAAWRVGGTLKHQQPSKFTYLPSANLSYIALKEQLATLKPFAHAQPATTCFLYIYISSARLSKATAKKKPSDCWTTPIPRMSVANRSYMHIQHYRAFYTLKTKRYCNIEFFLSLVNQRVQLRRAASIIQII
jgi:hypothetical protein